MAIDGVALHAPPGVEYEKQASFFSQIYDSILSSHILSNQAAYSVCVVGGCGLCVCVKFGVGGIVWCVCVD